MVQIQLSFRSPLWYREMTTPKDVTKSYLEQLPEWPQPKCFIIDLKFHMKHRTHNIVFFTRKGKEKTNKKTNKNTKWSSSYVNKYSCGVNVSKLSLEGIPIGMS